MSRSILPIYSLLELILMCRCLVLANANVPCVDVMIKMLPCEEFLLSGAYPSPSVACCGGAQALDKQLAEGEKPDREAVCLCLKKLAQTLPIIPDKPAKLSALCNLPIQLPIDPNVDCNKFEGQVLTIPSKDLNK